MRKRTKCIYPNCQQKGRITKGLCQKHYAMAYHLTRTGRTTWETLYKNKKAIKPVENQVDWFLEGVPTQKEKPVVKRKKRNEGYRVHECPICHDGVRRNKRGLSLHLRYAHNRKLNDLEVAGVRTFVPIERLGNIEQIPVKHEK